MINNNSQRNTMRSKLPSNIILIVIIVIVLILIGVILYFIFRKKSTTTTTSSLCTKTSNCGSPPTTQISGPTTPPKVKQVFNIRDNLFNYNDAKAICKAYNSELATLPQVIDAYNNGANWCNYGWSQDQLALYPTQKKYWENLQKDENRKNNCGVPGVNGGYFNNNSYKFGANCYGYKPPPKPGQKVKPDFARDPLSKKSTYYKQTLTNYNINPFNTQKWSE